MRQRTIQKTIEVMGIGLHTGEPIRLRIEPLDVDAGIVFYRSDLALSIPLKPESVVDTQMATVIGDKNKGTISTIEHFLSAVNAYGIDNLRVVVDGPEIPIMDGSAISFCLLLDEAGIAPQHAAKKVWKILKPLEVKEGNKYVRLTPAKKSVHFDVAIDFDHPVIGKQHYRFDFSTKGFVEQIARARTFGFAKEIRYLQSINLAKGASLHNAIGLDSCKVLNPEGLRFEDEFVRHKILDAMGDMMVAGVNLYGNYEALAAGHSLNHRALMKLVHDRSYVEIVTFETLQEEAFAQAFA